MVAVITGASAGIGAAIAEKLSKEYSKEKKGSIVLIARRKDKLESVQKKIKEKWGFERVFIFSRDVSCSKEIKNLFKKIEEEVGPIDLLVNNAGLALGIEPGQEANLDEWQQMININIQGLVNCTHAVLASMVKRNQGQIINLGSVAGSYPYPGGNVYCGTKAFVHQFSLSLRSDLLGTKVRVSCIEPGLVGDTEFSLVRFHGDEKRVSGLYKGADALTPEDIAETVYFCISQPAHVNINTIELMPISQAFSPLAVERSSK